MNKLLLKKFKSLFLILLIVPILMLSFNSQKTEAIVGFDDALELGTVGGTITIGAGSLMALVGSSLVASGVMLDATSNDGLVCKYVANKLVQGGSATQYVGLKVSDSGKQFLTWTQEGINWLKNTVSDVITNGVPVTGVNSLGSFSYFLSAGSNVSFTYIAFGENRVNTYKIPKSGYYDVDISTNSIGSTSCFVSGKNGDGMAFTLDKRFPFTNYSITSTSGESVCAPLSNTSYSNYNFNADVLGKNVIDGNSLSYQPRIGIPLTDSGTISHDGIKVYNPDISIPYGRSWGEIRDILTLSTADENINIPEESDIEDATPNVTTSAAVELALKDVQTKYQDDDMNYQYKGDKYIPSNPQTLVEFYKLEAIAEEMYNKFRGATDDVEKVAKNTGLDIDDIQQIKNHLFIDKIRFANGTVEQFPSDYEQAVAWERLISGEYYESDILLLKHELYESTYMKLYGCVQETAHEATNVVFNWAKFLKQLGGK